MSSICARTVTAAASAVLCGVVAVGCSNGQVHDQQQHETVTPEGTAVQTRTQTRETPSGATVKETETRQREVVNPAPGGHSDPTQKDPGK